MPDLTAWLASARAKVEAADGAPRELRDGVYLGVALRHLPALLDVVEAAAKYRVANDISEEISSNPRNWRSKECEDAAVAVISAEDALDAALARLAKEGE